jgi:uncharacterized protein YggE
MTKWLSAILLGCFCLVAAQGASAADQPGKMRILGHATVEAVPDIVTVMVGVTVKAATPTAALDQNSAAARKVIDFSKRFGVADEDIQTEAVNLSPHTKIVRDPDGTQRQETDGYTATNTVRVRLRDVARLGPFMRQVLDQGANTIGGVQFGLADPDKVMDDARVKAVDDAVRQAELLAHAAKVQLGAIQDIIHPPRVQMQPMGMPRLAMRAKRADVPIEAGVISVTAEVDITWSIE